MQNVNDLKAQVAANQKGVAELRAAVAQFGLEVVQAYMEHVQDNAAESVRGMLKSLPDGEFSYEIDQGSVIRVKITVDRQAGEARDRLHRHIGSAAGQLQRPAAGDPGGGALRAAGAGRGRDS